MAIIPTPPSDVRGPIRPEAAKKALATGKWDDPSVLQLVIQDTERAENFESTKQWVLNWPTASLLFQSPYAAKYWEGTQTERANIPFFTVATCVESLVPQIISGLFYQDPPFMIKKRGKTTMNHARAVQTVLAFQLEDINFKHELRMGAKNACLFGTGIWKWGWETFTEERSEYRRAELPVRIPNAPGLDPVTISPDEEEIEEVVTKVQVNRPTFDHIVNLRHVMVDPGLNVPDIRRGKYVVHRMFLTWKDLDKLRDRPGFDIPDQHTLLELFFPPKEPVQAAAGEVTSRNPLFDARAEARFEETTVDPFNQPLEVLERWDNDHVMVVLQKKLVICNAPNPYGVIPFLSIGWWDVPEAFWSMGLAKTIGSEQRLQQGITNSWLDGVSLNLNGVYVRVRGKSVPTQSIRVAPGRIVDVDNKGDFSPLERLPAVPEAGAALQMSQTRADQYSGADALSIQGSLSGGGRSSITRTATGANILAGGSGSRVQDFVGKLADQVFLPFLYAAHELNCALLPPKTIKQILDEELEEAWVNEIDVLDVINARVKFTISAAARLQARRNMAQALPIMIQYLMSPETTQSLAIEGMKVNVKEIMRMMFEVSDWPNVTDVVVAMSDEDKQRWMSMQPGAQVAAKAKAQAGLQSQKTDDKSHLIDQENIARAGREVLRSAIEKAAEPEEITGQPGGPGFGANV
ncbi:MAG: hypothetical protein JWQ87_1999 [Candidatus Sulfotelmatobacter sp.]|nr:hypothetical protein [Candidatus Sulfotelmatobacter sp.]